MAYVAALNLAMSMFVNNEGGGEPKSFSLVPTDAFAAAALRTAGGFTGTVTFTFSGSKT